MEKQVSQSKVIITLVKNNYQALAKCLDKINGNENGISD